MNEFYNKMKYFKETEKIESKVYYHYTSIQSLFSIIKNKSFWLTNLKSSNDKKELYYTYNNFKEDLKSLHELETEENLKSYFKILNTNASKYEKNIESLLKQKMEYYSLSLVDKPDNLTHWERYALNSTGVCIGINIAASNVFFRRNNDWIGENLLTINKVEYSKANKLKAIRISLINSFKMYKELCLDSDNKIIEDKAQDGIIPIYIIFNHFRKFYKHNSFIDEAEYRILFEEGSVKSSKNIIKLLKDLYDEIAYENMMKNFLYSMKMLCVEEKQFSLFGGTIRSYHELCLKSVWGSGVINEIIIGPKCTQSLSELRAFLKTNGLQGTRVTVSKVPLR